MRPAFVPFGLAHLAALALTVATPLLLAALLLGARAQMRRFGVPISVAGVAAIALLAGLLSENELRNQLQALETDVLMLLANVPPREACKPPAPKGRRLEELEKKKLALSLSRLELNSLFQLIVN